MWALEAENEAAFADVREESLDPKEPVQLARGRFCSTNTSVGFSSGCSENAATTWLKRKTSSVNTNAGVTSTDRGQSLIGNPPAPFEIQ